MADSDRDYSKVKPIKLAPWNAEEFLLWQRMVTLTFRIHGVWSIVDGSEPMPTPPTPPTLTGDNAMGITTLADASFTCSLEDWRRRNTLACEALVNCVKGHELRHISIMENAHDIWTLLDQTYGRKSFMRLATAQLELRKLLKQPTTSMQAHIDAFENLRSTIDNNSSKPMEKPDVNQTFISSLGPSWIQFHQANQQHLAVWEPEQLYDEVKAFEQILKSSLIGSASSDTSPNTSPSTDNAQANAATVNQKGKRKGNGYGPYNNNNPNPSKKSKYCHVHNSNRHDIS